MEKLQKERDKLLLYALQNPPPHVTVILPPRSNPLTELDLSQMESPLPLYTTASESKPMIIKVEGSPPMLTISEGRRTSTSYDNDHYSSGGSSGGHKVKRRGVERFSSFMANLLRNVQGQSSAKEAPVGSSRDTVSSFFYPAEKHRRNSAGEHRLLSRSLVDGSSIFSSEKPQHRNPLPIEGLHEFTITEYIAPYLTNDDYPARDPLKFPDPPSIELCPVIENDVLNDFGENYDKQNVLFYEHILLGVDVFIGPQAMRYEKEVCSGFLKAFNISDAQHVRSLQNLKQLTLDRRDLPISIDITTIQRLVDTSVDKEFVQRMKKILRISRKHPDTPGGNEYPLALRAFIYAGALCPLYKIDTRRGGETLLQEEQVSYTLTALRRKLGISSALDPFCRLHARLLSMDEKAELERQRAFLKEIATAVNALSRSTQSLGKVPLTPETKYKLYILQEIFELCCIPMTLISAINSEHTIICVSALFLESCVSLPSEFLSVYVRIDGRQILPPTSSVDDFLLVLLMVFVGRSVLRTFSSPKFLMNSAEPPQQLLDKLTSVGDRARAYCELLSHSVQHAVVLILPGISLAASHVIAQHWAKAIRGDKTPDDFVEGITALLSFLAKFSSPGVENDKEMSRALLSSTRRQLSWIAPLIERYDYSVREQVRQKLRKAKLSLQDVGHFTRDAQFLVVALVEEIVAPMPSPLLWWAQELVFQRLSYVSDCINDTAGLVKGRFVHPNIQNEGITQQSGYIQEYKRLLELGEKMSVPPLSLDDITLRLNSLFVLKSGWKRYLAFTKEDYRLVRGVTGVPAISFEHLVRSTGEHLAEMVFALCEYAAVAIIRVEIGSLLFEKFLKTDMRLLRSMKTDKTSASGRRHLPREFPDVTMKLILQKLESSFGTLAEQLSDSTMVREVRTRALLHFVASLFYVFLEGTHDRLFCPEEVDSILEDLDNVDAFIQSFQTTESDVDKKHHPIVHIRELLQNLRQIVRYCFSQTTSVLTDGGEGVPPFAQLPETSGTSPWCKYIVRRVLDHRNDKTRRFSFITHNFFRRDEA
ncbi:uncharacterized protein TM35_000152920 [Trypanosoma theileri]|uniref:Uncharacterized protein n=1 Tax=Trypanosoma theileri TaxID=67003 RepID=A0A1X0NW62_9TRYP|nr:uncharacterized protein TM35_000152920 [Trypanosoma theileri]ORC88861.1 hypothetical protein TM35_000152920 [Trypanosoma theileri]